MTQKHLAAVEDTYEFRKTARHEVSDKKWFAKWDENGRYFVIFGRKNSPLDKGHKSIKFYNMFGELLQIFTDLAQLDKVHFRPRPTDTLKQDQIKKLKKEYKKKYEKLVKDDEAHERKVQGDIVKEKKKQIRDDFLNNFFIPLRQDYEKKIKQYQALFPIKESDFSEKEAEYNNIYAYGETLTQRKIELE